MYPFQRWFPAPASLAASARVWGRPPAHFTVSWSIEEEKYWSTESTVQWCSAAVSMRGPGFDSRHNKGVLHGPSLVTLGCASVNCDYRMRSKTPAFPSRFSPLLVDDSNWKQLGGKIGRDDGAHTCKPNTWEVEAERSGSSRLSSATEWVGGKPELHITVSNKQGGRIHSL